MTIVLATNCSLPAFITLDAEFEAKASKNQASQRQKRNEKASSRQRRKYWLLPMFRQVSLNVLPLLYSRCGVPQLAMEEMAFLDAETKARRKVSLKEFYTRQEEM